MRRVNSSQTPVRIIVGVRTITERSICKYK